MKLLLDMNLPPALLQPLVDAGYVAVHWSMVGNAGATDAVVLASALAHGQVLVTHDLDFSALLAASGQRGPSVLQLRTGDLHPDRYFPLLIAALGQARDALEQGALVSVSAAEARIRILPLR